uniref:Uncharacterized protein n=1 Tax=Ananas comosus var. bracteatus TaxID=296719 RepID=A0A6V7QSD1_ANACO
MAKPDGHPSSPSRTEEPAAVGSSSSPCSSSAAKAKRAASSYTERARDCREAGQEPAGRIPSRFWYWTDSGMRRLMGRAQGLPQALPEGRGGLILRLGGSGDCHVPDAILSHASKLIGMVKASGIINELLILLTRKIFFFFLTRDNRVRAIFWRGTSSVNEGLLSGSVKGGMSGQERWWSRD